MGPRKNQSFYVLHVISVTRFGEISPLWQNFNSLWLLFEDLFCIGQNLELIGLGIFVGYWANLHCCYWPNIEEII